MRYFILFFILLCVSVVVVSGFRGQKFAKPPIEIFPDMDHQEKVKAQVGSDFYGDALAARKPIEGTVPIGFGFSGEVLNADPIPGHGDGKPILVTDFKVRSYTSAPDYLNTGQIDGKWGDGIPLEVTPELIARGHERYMINCQVCHGEVGDGLGVAGNYGLIAITSYHSDRLRDMPDGEIYNTIANGKGTMMAYGHQVSLYDRWAIVAWIRVLQRSQYAPESALTATERQELSTAQ